MYDVTTTLPTDTLSPGTDLLGVSPPMLGARRLAYRFLAEGLDAEDGCVVVTTDTDAETVAEAVDRATSTATLDRLGIVDATGNESPGDVPYRVEPLGSPADLTGIGIALTDLLETLHGTGTDGYRVVVDSLSSLLVYREFEEVYRFTDAITNQTDRVGGTSLSLLGADTDREYLGRFQRLFDGLVELREGERDAEGNARTEYRLRGLAVGGEWHPLPLDDDSVTVPAGVASTGIEAGDAGGSSPSELELGPDPPGSLREIIEAIDAAKYTLTLCNYTGTGEGIAELRDHFERLNVAVRTTELRTDTPTDVAILHRGADAFAMDPVAELRDAIRLDALDPDGEVVTVERPDVLDHVYRREYTVENGGKLRMVRISRLIEARALDAGTGTLHAGFQRLNRVEDEFRTRELYEWIARTDVDVHLYGQPGRVPNEEWYTLHTADDGELADAWFVVYDGGGQDGLKGVLLSEETGPEEYTGFWTYEPTLVDTIETYLRSTYG